VDTSSLQKLVLILGGSVKRLFKDGLLLYMLELGLEVLQASRIAAAVGAAASAMDVEAFILDFLTVNSPAWHGMVSSTLDVGAAYPRVYSPATLASTILLGLLGINIDMTRLGKVAGKILLIMQ
jgi:hypothetical protein